MDESYCKQVLVCAVIALNTDWERPLFTDTKVVLNVLVLSIAILESIDIAIVRTSMPKCFHWYCR